MAKYVIMNCEYSTIRFGSQSWGDLIWTGGKRRVSPILFDDGFGFVKLCTLEL